MATARRPNTARRRSASPAGGSHSVCPDLPLEPGPGSSERIDRDIFVHVHGLGVLSQVVETREAPGAMALEWALAGVLPRKWAMISKQFSGDIFSVESHLIWRAKCSLLVKLRLQGG